MSKAPRRKAHYLSVVGARPQFIKLAPLHAALHAAGRHTILHTGQHYDPAMSAAFFRELKLPRPNLNLGVRGGGHAAPTGRMLVRLARAIERLTPDWVLVYGDTTSTLAGALAGAQSGVRVAHVEAGLRSFDRRQPEERNRIVADHIADLRFCPTTTAVDNLRREGITAGVHRVGDPMEEALAWHVRSARGRRTVLPPGAFLFCTVHRAENTDDRDRLARVVELLRNLEIAVVFTVHPRTEKALRAARLWRRLASAGHLQLYRPFGYLDTLRHIQAARAVLTDSGGVQRESAWLGTPCLTLRPTTEWLETVRRGQNVLVDLDLHRVRRALARAARFRPRSSAPPGVARRIVRRLQSAR